MYVEKPLALQVDQGQELVDIAEKGTEFSWGRTHSQYHPAILRLKELIGAGGNWVESSTSTPHVSTGASFARREHPLELAHMTFPPSSIFWMKCQSA